ncbi:MAG: hypothetical protein CSA62_00230 [Planctomycetota bacterium]|nr:MAG: hypothetical protein CSA62_00230 [Planctomycetota bacterium]
MFRALLAALLCLTTAPISAQLRLAAKKPSEAALHWVDGRALLRVQLSAPPKLYTCHLLLDLLRPEALFLHENAASVLKAGAATVKTGGLELPSLPYAAKRITWLEEFTKEHAEELEEIPVAGMIGLAAFGDARVEIDGPASLLRLGGTAGATGSSGAGPGGEKRPQPSNGGVVLDLLAQPLRSGLQVAMALAPDRQVTARLHSGAAASMISPKLAQKLGHADGVLPYARLGSLALDRLGVFFPYETPKGCQVTIGGRMLRQLRIAFDPRGDWLLVEPGSEAKFPEDEAAFQRALFGKDAIAGLRSFLKDFPESSFRASAAHSLVHKALKATPPDPELVLEAAQLSIAAARKGRNCEETFKILKELPSSLGMLRRSILQFSLKHIDPAAEPERLFEVRLLLGRIARLAGDLKEARRHLLSAAFGLPRDGRVQLELGALHEQQGQFGRARGAYLLALLDTKQTGEIGLRQLQALHPKLPEKDRPLAEVLEEWCDGRVPAFHPMPREPEAIAPSGRVVLAELFTGAMCRPCLAADLAIDALAEHYGSKELLAVQWHLPVPEPEPLVTLVSQQRAQRCDVRSTPTMRIGGVHVLSGGGDAELAPELFGRLSKLVQAEAKKPVRLRLSGQAQVKGDEIRAKIALQMLSKDSPLRSLRLHAILTESPVLFPGKNGVLFHRHVARARLTPRPGLAVAELKEGRAQILASLREIEDGLERTMKDLDRDQENWLRHSKLDPRQLQILVFVEDTLANEGRGEVVQAHALCLETAKKPAAKPASKGEGK